MNWVGGWRSRVVKSSDTRKQKEFFEKQRMQNRHNLLAPAPPAPPKTGNVGNMDLLTMFIVNQIALKKEHAGNPERRRLPKLKENRRSMGGDSLELSMSPCSPSRLNLAEGESHYSEQALGLKKRKPKMLSPLLETNLSDNSTSVCQYRVQGSVGSFSSASQSSSDAFNLQTRPSLNIFSSPPTELHCTETALPVELCEYNLWTVPHQTSQTSFADKVQFGSTLSRSDSSGPSIHDAENPFNNLEMNDQEENPHIFGRNNEIEDNSGKSTTKQNFRKEEPHLPTESQDFTQSYNNDHSIDFLSQHMSMCVDNRPGREHRKVSEHAWKSPVTCSHRESYFTSDDGTNSNPSLSYTLEKGPRQDGDSYLCHSKDILTTSQGCPSGTSASTRYMCNHENRERESKPHRILQNLRQINHKQNSEKDQFVPTCLPQSGKMHKKASPKTQDKASQTAGFSSRTSQDASVQCCLLKASRMRILNKPTAHIHHSRTYKASFTRRQTSENVASKIPNMERNHFCMMAKQEPTKHSPETIIRHGEMSECESQSCRNNGTFLHSSHRHDPELKEQPVENMVLRGESCEGYEESAKQNPTVIHSCTKEPNITFTAETSGHREPEGNLKEIADILLMLKQKHKHS